MEIKFLESLASLRFGVLDVIMLFFTYIGEVGAVCIITALVLLIMKKTRKAGIYVAICLILDFLIINVFLKNVVQRARPYEFSQSLVDRIISLKYKLPDDYSFPSGHSAVTFCCATALVCLFGKKALFTFVIAFLVAFSRLYIGVHYPTDVLAGAVIGSAIGFCTVYFGRKIENKFFNKNKRQE